MGGLETSLLAAAAKETAAPIKSFIANRGRAAFDQLAVKFGSQFQAHVESARARCGKIKNILYRDQSVGLESQYVKIYFSWGKSTRSDDQAASMAISGKKLLISGTAGAGKTMFMKWLTLELISSIESHGKVPLYLELRYIDDEFTKSGLLDYVYTNTSSAKDRSSFEQFKIGLEVGMFALVLDAVDEVNPLLWQNVVREIRLFAVNYPHCALIVSSRPDSRLESISEFGVLRTRQMTLKQAEEVLNRLDYDEGVKEALGIRLPELFETHREFLSNPLLITIMLLTFDHSADVPTKLTAFYKQAFEVLYQRHDAAKGAYRRGHYAGLPLDIFESVFSAFSFNSFINSRLEFSDSDLLSYFRSAARYFNVDVDPTLLIHDAMLSVCVIQKDGLLNVFVHKTFQEYFTALFISNYKEDDVSEIVETVASRTQGENVLRMLVEIARETFEYNWALPLLDRFFQSTKSIDIKSESGLREFFVLVFDAIYVNPYNGMVEFVSWNDARSVSGGVASRWMATIEEAHSQKVYLYRQIYSDKGIFDDLESYIGNLPLDSRPNKRKLWARAEASPLGDDDTEVIRIGKDDVYWLLNSDLPRRAEAIRTSARKLRGEIMARRNNRRGSISRLLEKKLIKKEGL